jgi:hypothetical protein
LVKGRGVQRDTPVENYHRLHSLSEMPARIESGAVLVAAKTPC